MRGEVILVVLLTLLRRLELRKPFYSCHRCRVAWGPFLFLALPTMVVVVFVVVVVLAVVTFAVMIVLPFFSIIFIMLLFIFRLVVWEVDVVFFCMAKETSSIETGGVQIEVVVSE